MRFYFKRLFQVSYYVAEFWNTLSNVFIFGPPVFGIADALYQGGRGQIQRRIPQVDIQRYSSSLSQCFVTVVAKSCEGLLLGSRHLLQQPASRGNP